MDWIKALLENGALPALIASVTWFLLNKLATPVLIEKVRQIYLKDIESLRHELTLAKSTYDQYLNTILKYYARIYKHYRSCQNVVNADVAVFPDGTKKWHKEEYLKNLDSFVRELSKDEGYIRLLLPDRLLKLVDALIGAFNNFRDAAKTSTSDNKRRVIECFQEIDDKKNELELGLREFLRTEKLLK